MRRLLLQLGKLVRPLAKLQKKKRCLGLSSKRCASQESRRLCGCAYTHGSAGVRARNPPRAGAGLGRLRTRACALRGAAGEDTHLVEEKGVTWQGGLRCRKSFLVSNRI